MGNWTNLYIGDEEIASFKYSLGEEVWKALSLIFKKEDFVRGKYKLSGQLKNYVGYEITVKEAKRRLSKYHMTMPHMIRTFRRLGIGRGELISHCDDFSNHEDEFNYMLETHASEEIIPVNDYIYISYFRQHIDRAVDSKHIILDISDVLDMADDRSERQEMITGFNDLLDPNKIIERPYLEMAKVFFTTCDYDLVYVYLVMSVERELYSYYERKTAKGRNRRININLETTFKALSFMNKLKLVNLLSNKNIIPDRLVEEFSKVYQKRTSIVHFKSLNFNRNDVNVAIEISEKINKIVHRLAR